MPWTLFCTMLRAASDEGNQAQPAAPLDDANDALARMQRFRERNGLARLDRPDGHFPDPDGTPTPIPVTFIE